jgi:hypothetical protein
LDEKYGKDKPPTSFGAIGMSYGEDKLIGPQIGNQIQNR